MQTPHHQLQSLCAHFPPSAKQKAGPSLPWVLAQSSGVRGSTQALCPSRCLSLRVTHRGKCCGSVVMPLPDSQRQWKTRYHSVSVFHCGPPSLPQQRNSAQAASHFTLDFFHIYAILFQTPIHASIFIIKLLFDFLCGEIDLLGLGGQFSSLA